MAGPSIGTWVKVRSKSGGTTPRVLAKKFGGGAYQQGQVITQSEYESYKKQRAEAKKAGGAKTTEDKKIGAKPRAGEQLRYNELAQLRHNALSQLVKSRSPKKAKEKLDRVEAQLKELESRFPGIKHTITQNKRMKELWENTEAEGRKKLSTYIKTGKRNPR